MRKLASSRLRRIPDELSVTHRHTRFEDAIASEDVQAGSGLIVRMRTSLFGAMLSVLAASAAAADLTVSVENVNSAEGKLRVGLFTSAQAFPGTPERGASVPAAPGTGTVVFRDLAPGNYAVSAYHDLNDNRKLDTGLFGRPAEPLGFSRDARVRMGPPAFGDAVFAVDNAAAKIVVRLRQ